MARVAYLGLRGGGREVIVVVLGRGGLLGRVEMGCDNPIVPRDEIVGARDGDSGEDQMILFKNGKVTTKNIPVS
jgi:hypothetical protein